MIRDHAYAIARAKANDAEEPSIAIGNSRYAAVYTKPEFDALQRAGVFPAEWEFTHRHQWTEEDAELWSSANSGVMASAEDIREELIDLHNYAIPHLDEILALAQDLRLDDRSLRDLRSLLTKINRAAGICSVATSMLSKWQAMLQAEVSFLQEAVLVENAAERAQARAKRIKLSHAPQEYVEMGRKCSNCGKKPARVDDLCKVCARASGIVVKGKIGG